MGNAKREKTSITDIAADLVVGIDPSLTSTGVSTVLGEETISAPTGVKGMERVEHIAEAIADAIYKAHSEFIQQRYDYCKVTGVYTDFPEVREMILIEGYALNTRNPGHAFSLGELCGFVKWHLTTGQPTRDLVLVPPACRAKFATGRGNASKQDVISHVTARTGRLWEGKGSDDKADAWTLREMGLALLGKSEYDWPKANLSALDKLELPDWLADLEETNV